MRLNKASEVRATNELLAILAEHPEGLTTSSLSGTPQFYGMRTLSNRQIIRLLRASGRVREWTVGFGIRTASLWTLMEKANTVAPRQAADHREHGPSPEG